MKALWSQFDKTAGDVLAFRAKLQAPAGKVRATVAVSYTHLTLPTNREV